MYKVRFHLAKGQNFMKWQIKSSTNTFYIDPEFFDIRLKGVTLKNQKGTATKINEGANKTVCAWMVVDDYIVLPSSNKDESKDYDRLQYNPRNNPFWNMDGVNIDNNTYGEVRSFGRSLFTKG